MEAAEIETAEGLVERVAAIDVAKASGMVCMRLPHPTREGRHVPGGLERGGNHERSP
ncbi:hypothetical protein [Streptomyces sp. NPDC059909]|uniref:hypothetical protein n=1 Tax=Streptomyces sp. NPDC059909 TaxID=3346998 RepID=UPI0036524DBA